MRSILAFFTLFALSTGVAAADTLPPQLASALANFGSAKSYHLAMTTQGQQMDIDIVNPGRQHMTMRGGQMEMIHIDSDSYIKMNGSWQKFSMPGMDAMVSRYAKYRDVASYRTTDAKVTDLGMTSADGAPMHEYEITTTGGEPADFYVGGDGMIHQIVVKSKNGPVTMVVSGYNAPITIVAPI